MYGASRRRAIVAQMATRLVVALVGPRVLGSREWEPPFEPGVWDELCRAWRAELGSFDEIALYERPQASRTGLAALLLDRGHGVGFVKVRQSVDDANFSREWAVLSAMASRGDEQVRTVAPLAVGAVDSAAWLAVEALPAGVNRPVRDPPIGHLTRLLVETLTSVLPRPEEVPSHWRPMHGDLTPWNFRSGCGQDWLVDWDDVGWGPPGADGALFWASAEAIGLGAAPGQPTEAVEFWRRRVSSRPEDDEDASFNSRLLEVLEKLTGPH